VPVQGHRRPGRQTK